MKILRFCSLVLATAVVVATLSLSNSSPTLGQQPAPLSTQPITDKELVRNGDFAQYDSYNKPNGWIVAEGTGSAVNVSAGQDGGPVMSMEAIMETQASLYQELRLPSQTTSAALVFDYRLLLPDYPAGGAAQFYAQVETTSGLIANLLTTPVVNSDTGWQSFNSSLDSAVVAQIQSAHAAGQAVYLTFYLLQNPANSMKAYLDNVSFRVSGSMNYPTLSGSIAYVGFDEHGYPKTVKRIDPDGSNHQTLWTHPSTIPSTNAIYDVAWKPNAGEIAFSSNHESIYSAFHSDVYGIKPDGSGLRRITNPPAKSEIDAGGYQMGTVSGIIHNNYGNVITFLLYIEGAQDAIAVDIGNFNDQVNFTVPNVADLGAGFHYAVFTWSDGSNANCKEYAAAVVNVIPGQTVDAGTLTFGGTCGTYESTSISWKRDGSYVGVDVIAPRKFLATGEALGSDLFTAPLTADELAWSPVDDRILYRNLLVSGDKGIYLTTENGGTGTWLVDEGYAVWVTPAWLPDGSGFIYTIDHQIRHYNLANNQDTLLANFYNEYVFNPSVSPNGGYVVFEWQTNANPVQKDLWIMDRSNPVEMWALTTDGKSTDPDWSHQTAPSSYKVYLPAILK